MNRKNPTHHLDAFCQTDTGLRRTSNEDVCSISIEHQYFMVADGIAGASAGEIASALFLEAVTETIAVDTSRTREECQELIQACFSLANTKIQEHVTENPAHKGMGCTAELLLICDNQYVLGHVGDSRTYCFNDNEINQLTTDHSLVQQQLDQGIISQHEADESKYKNVLMRAIGANDEIEVEISYGTIIPGTIFLLCTDGLYNMVKIDHIVPVLSYDAPLSMKTEMLINMANAAGGRDNISISLVNVL